MTEAHDMETEQEIRQWKDANKYEFAFKVAEVARIILRQELLGEK
jgi:hypothetical protein